MEYIHVPIRARLVAGLFFRRYQPVLPSFEIGCTCQHCSLLDRWRRKDRRQLRALDELRTQIERRSSYGCCAA
jgi:hypothetical protein